MTKKPREVPAGEFKAKCLKLLDEVAATGLPIVVTKRRRPVARLVPVEEREPQDLRGSVIREEDIVSPVETRWDAAG